MLVGRQPHLAGWGAEPQQPAFAWGAQHALRRTRAQHAGGGVSPSDIDNVTGMADLADGCMDMVRAPRQAGLIASMSAEATTFAAPVQGLHSSTRSRLCAVTVTFTSAKPASAIVRSSSPTGAAPATQPV